VTELLDFARPAEPRPISLVLPERVLEALEAARKDPSCKELEPRIETALPDTLPHAWADPDILRRALVNVFMNALQHVPRDGVIRVSADHPGGDLLRVRIYNDGAAIPPDQAARVFEPFFTTRAAGTGLGLAVVKQALESLHGRVELEPRSEGVSFALWIPQEPAGV